MRTVLFKCLVLFMLTLPVSAGSTYFVDPEKGDDGAAGSLQAPFKTLAKAATMIGAATTGAVTIKLAPGTYKLSARVTLAGGAFTAAERLTIEGLVLPDEPQWLPKHMPVIKSIEDGGEAEGEGKALYGFDIGTSHVTVRGILFHGSTAAGHRYYPIRRDGNQLDDLLVTQCAFIGKRDGLPIHVAVIARGHGTVVDHCLFMECRNTTVFWAAEGGVSRGNGLRHSIAIDSYVSGLWTTDTDSDFEFHHNLFHGGKIFHIRLFNRERHFTLADSYVLGFEVYNRATDRPGAPIHPEPVAVTYTELRLQKEGVLDLDLDEANGENRNYLHPKPGSAGSSLNAGLFMGAQTPK